MFLEGRHTGNQMHRKDESQDIPIWVIVFLIFAVLALWFFEGNLILPGSVSLAISVGSLIRALIR